MPMPAFSADAMFLFFSQIDGLRVIDREDKLIGFLYDIIIEPIGKYARSKALVISRKGLPRTWAVVDWLQVGEVAERYVRLRIPADQVSFNSALNHRSDLSLRQDILDQQVVDTNNHNVIRVNDIHLLRADQDLVVAHVDIGLRGIVRRLGFEKGTDALVRFFKKDAHYLQNLRLISWKHIQPLSINPVSMTIKVDVSQKQLLEIPVEDLSELMLDFTPQHRLALFKTLDLGTKTQLFTHLDFKEQKFLLEEMNEQEAVEILNRLPTDEAVDFLGELPGVVVRRFLALMESKSAKMLSTLLGYSGESAAGLMTTEFIAVSKEATVEEVIRIIKEKTLKVETIQNIYIIDKDNHLVASTFLKRLIVADPQANVMTAALKKTVSLHMEDDVKKIAFLMDKYKINVLPVVDSGHVIVGIITIDDIFSRLVSIAWRRQSRKKNN